MSLRASTESYKLIFKFEAGTSRGTLKQKQTHFLKVWDHENDAVKGIGEAGPLVGLSVDDHADFPNWIKDLSQQLSGKNTPTSSSEISYFVDMIPASRPALRFALETALWDLIQGRPGVLFDNDFTKGRSTIPINGLIWMGEVSFMRKQIDLKIAAGYQCIKLKIGAIDFREECRLLKYIRENAPASLILRVDANGAFNLNEASEKLAQLKEYNVHSIEQPIGKGQINAMELLCRTSPVPIALDEELIGITDYNEKLSLLERIKPQFIVLKPTLLGGFASTSEWITLAESLGIGWWITSALESNVGLSAIAQYTADLNYQGHQGLGTGQLYINNLDTPLFIEKGYLCYEPSARYNQ